MQAPRRVCRGGGGVLGSSNTPLGQFFFKARVPPPPPPPATFFRTGAASRLASNCKTPLLKKNNPAYATRLTSSFFPSKPLSYFFFCLTCFFLLSFYSLPPFSPFLLLAVFLLSVSSSFYLSIFFSSSFPSFVLDILPLVIVSLFNYL